MKKIFAVLALAPVLAACAEPGPTAEEIALRERFERLDAARGAICAGHKDAADYSYSFREMEILRETERYREQAQQAVFSQPGVSWFSLSDHERCQAGRFQQREDQIREYFNKQAVGVGRGFGSYNHP